MEHSDAINELAAALAKAQGQMRAASKDATNPHFRSRYADLAAVWDACREPLASNGLSVVQMPGVDGEGRATLRTMLLHSSGQWLATTAAARLVKDDPQGYGSALTYLRRYSLAAMVGVVADEDDDSNAASGRNNAPTRATSYSPRQAQPDDDPAMHTARQVKTLVDAIRKLGGTPPTVSAAQIRDMSEAERNALIERLRHIEADLLAAA